MPPVIVFWFRRDLRLTDNHGLSQAIDAARERGFVVLPLFIFDDSILDPLPKDDARVQFIHEQLGNMQKLLTTEGTHLCVKKGNVIDIFAELCAQFDLRAVFCNHDYEPSAIKRDTAVKAHLHEKNIAWRSYKDQVIFERDEVVKNDGKPYTVYTPYKKRWLAQFDLERDAPEYACDTSLFAKVSFDLPSLADIGFVPNEIRAYDYDFSAMRGYQDHRGFPAHATGTSKLSPHLRFGTISVRECVRRALPVNDTFLSELIWREFFMQVLWHFPRVVNESFRVEYDKIAWRNDEGDFQAWCDGKTGYPLVDAGMRELNTTGYMHNRVRMVTASFLCKHLLIDWRWGERYFAEKLLDYDLSANNGNWQWAAGTGCDAAPYFRIFNPETQFKKFDPDATYVREYVPEFDHITYTQPIVEHKLARERCLATYKKARE